MKLIRLQIAFITILVLFTTLSAQDAAASTTTTTSTSSSSSQTSQNTESQDGLNTPATDMKFFDIDQFEDAGVWQGEMPRDQGIIRVMRRDGAPKELGEKDPDLHKYVLGAKISFFKSGSAWFSVKPPKEVSIPGITKKLSIWVAGRNFKHRLKAVVRDFMGNLHILNFGKLTHPGWKKMETQVPTSIIQDEYRLFSKDNPRGIRFQSILVDCAMDETFGHYYIYLDDLQAYTDVFLETEIGKDRDNLEDNW